MKIYLSFLFISILVSCVEKQELKKYEGDFIVQKTSSDSLANMRVDRADALIHFIALKREFQSGKEISDLMIRQTITNLATNKSVTKPEIPKIFMIIGVLYQDLGLSDKAKKYYELEIKLANLAEAIDMEDTYKQNWRIAKIESLILLRDKKRLDNYKEELFYLRKHIRQELDYPFNYEFENVFGSYSLKKRVRYEKSVFTI